MKIRVPQLFKKGPYTSTSPHPDDGNVISPRRVNPPFIKIPGLKLCFEETTLDDANNLLPCYLYVGAIPAEGALPLAPIIEAALKKAFPKAQIAWEEAKIFDPKGQEVVWQKLRLTAEQLFDVKNSGIIEYKQFPAVFELWMRDTQDYIVLIGWRVPDSIEPKIHMLDFATAVAGSVTVDPPPEPAPDAAAEPAADGAADAAKSAPAGAEP